MMESGLVKQQQQQQQQPQCCCCCRHRCLRQQQQQQQQQQQSSRSGGCIRICPCKSGGRSFQQQQQHHHSSLERTQSSPSHNGNSSSSSNSLPILKRLQRLSAPSPTAARKAAASSNGKCFQDRRQFEDEITVIDKDEENEGEEGDSTVLRCLDGRLDEKQLLNSEEPGLKGGGGEFSGSCSSSTYIPSPLGSPSAARRSVQRLGDKICSSPILSRVRRRLGGGGGPTMEGQEPIKRSGGGFCGLFGGGDSEQTNIYLWSGGDTGRIANRHQEDRWDVWTTMGEDMWIEYESSSDEDDSTSDDDDDDDDSDDDDESDQEDDFLSLPLDDRRSFRR